jgi:hypothetical protein
MVNFLKLFFITAIFSATANGTMVSALNTQLGKFVHLVVTSAGTGCTLGYASIRTRGN